MDIESLRKLAEKATPGPWRVLQHKGYIDDDILTDHPDWQQKPHGNFVASTGLAAGHTHQNFSQTAAFIAACDPQTILALLDELEAARRHQEDGR